MNELPDDVMALLAQARLDQPRVSPAVRARVRLGVERTLATPALATKLTWSKLALPSFAALSGLTALTLMLLAPRQPSAPPASHREPTSVQAPPSVEPVTPVPPELEAPPHVAPARTARPAREESLAAELALIERADRALRDGDTTSATELLTQHRTRYRHGQLAHERDQLTVLADCMLGKADAKDHARELMRKPSLLRGRVAKACELEPPP